MTVTDILLATSGTEECTFNEFISGLSDKPTESSEWRELFEQLDHLESIGLLTIDRGYNNRINALQLTDHGVAEVKAALKEKRG